ncbi:MAG: hypothetical protein Kow00121_40330 [Elainellaceae cyanobacterium]
MSHFSDASDADRSQPERVRSVKPQLDLGLAALKRNAYLEAIAYLEAVHRKATDPSIRLKAVMGLVKAYAQVGNTEAAIAWCQPLQTHSNSQVQSWASKTLTELRQRVAASSTREPRLNEAEPDETGFMPSVNQTTAAPAVGDRQADTSQADNSPEDATGFVPYSTPEVTPSPSRRTDREIAHTSQPDLDSPAQASESDLEADEAAVLPDPETIVFEVTEAPPEQEQKLAATISPTASALPVPEPAPANHTPSQIVPVSQPAPVPEIQWRQAGRAQKWTTLGKVDLSKLWGVQALTVLLLIGIVDGLFLLGQAILNGLIFWFSWLPFLRSLQFEGNPVWLIAIGLALIFAASPWLLHWLLRRFYQLQPFSLLDLENYSPESVRLLKRISNQNRQPIPRLELLPDTAPVAFSYGYLMRQARIVVSQGLLAQLQDDEIAAIYAAELGHIGDRSVGVTAWVVLVAQLPYLLYRTVAAWGNRRRDRALQSIAVLVSSIGYGMYWCCRLAGLWLSRLRLYYSDRIAVEQTGNPNGLARALLKLTIGTAADIQQQRQTNLLLESFELLLPVSHRRALTLGSVYPYTATATLEWDRHHPYRRWFTLNNSHPVLGDRLHLLSLYARHWRLEPELGWEMSQTTSPTPRADRRATATLRRRFWRQGAPFFGIGIGLLTAVLLCLIGWLSYQGRWGAIDWLWLDRRAILLGSALLGFSIGLIVRINSFFPDIKRSNLQDTPLPSLLLDPNAMPVDSLPVRLQGKLIGRPGFYNRLYQDLILQTAQGAIRLHYSSRFGCIGNLLSQSRRPTELLKPNQPATVTGWLRRGATPWIDVDTIQPKQGALLRSGHPVWSTLVAIVCALLGVYVIFRG